MILHLLILKKNNNVVQQLEVICESPFYAEEEYEALVEEEEHKPVYTEDEYSRVHFNIELNVFWKQAINKDTKWTAIFQSTF